MQSTSLSGGIILIVTSVCTVYCWRPFSASIYDPDYKVYHPNVVDFNMTIENDDTFSSYFVVHQTLQSPTLSMEYRIDSGNGNYDMVLANKTYEICAFLDNRRMDVYLQLFMKIAEKHTNAPKHCPITKKVYYIRNMKIDPEYLPPVLPDKKGYAAFSLATKVEQKLTKMYDAKFFFKVEQKYKNEQM